MAEAPPRFSEYRRGGDPDHTYTRVMEPFTVDGITYKPPYLYRVIHGQISRPIFTIEHDLADSGWQREAAHSSLHDLDEWEDE